MPVIRWLGHGNGQVLSPVHLIKNMKKANALIVNLHAVTVAGSCKTHTTVLMEEQ